jgi:hypothetical protein
VGEGIIWRGVYHLEGEGIVWSKRVSSGGVFIIWRGVYHLAGGVCIICKGRVSSGAGA